MKFIFGKSVPNSSGNPGRTLRNATIQGRRCYLPAITEHRICVSCELISYNNSTKCLACSSTALLNLSRVLGGAIREQDRARIVDDAAINRVVDNILEKNAPAEFATESSTLICADQTMPSGLMCRTLPNALPQLQPAMRWVLQRACTATRADGAALALARRGKLVCHANAGSSVPDLCVEIDINR